MQILKQSLDTGSTALLKTFWRLQMLTHEHIIGKRVYP